MMGVGGEGQPSAYIALERIAGCRFAECFWTFRECLRLGHKGGAQQQKQRGNMLNSFHFSIFQLQIYEFYFI